jgi:hypothetical protein
MKKLIIFYGLIFIAALAFTAMIIFFMYIGISETIIQTQSNINF